MTRFKFTVSLSTLILCFAFGSSLAYAQAQRTWVSGTGDDANPCSRTAPCKTFAGAISKTAFNGEIDTMDSGAYGAVTITRSITIDGSKHVAGILASGGNGIVINIDPAGSDAVHAVRLRGLSISGAASNAKGSLRGIYVLNTNATDLKVYIDDIIIDSFANEGIFYNANGGDLVVKNCVIRNNNKAGIKVDSNGANLVYVRVDNTTANFNQEGMRFEDGVRGTITNSDATGNTLNGYVVFPSTLASEMNIDSSTAANNRQYGVISINSGAITSTIRITNSEVTNNVTNGLYMVSGGQICSNGKNHITTPTQAPVAACAFTDQ